MAGVAGRFHGTFTRILRNSKIISPAQYTKNFITPAVTTVVSHRDSSFRSSKVVRDISEYPEVEVHKDPPEWKYVERLLGSVTIPKPEKKPTYSSGWKPPQKIDGTQKYFVARTKNFMVPVYLHVKFRGQRRITAVRYVQGDIWSLEEDLRKAIEESRGGKIVASRVNELSGQIHFHGDHVNFVRDWLVSKGF